MTFPSIIVWAPSSPHIPCSTNENVLLGPGDRPRHSDPACEAQSVPASERLRVCARRPPREVRRVDGGAALGFADEREGI
jgi:hypothetical protein